MKKINMGLIEKLPEERGKRDLIFMSFFLWSQPSWALGRSYRRARRDLVWYGYNKLNKGGIRFKLRGQRTS